MDEYQQACERHARVLREIEDEEKAMMQPQQQQQQRSSTLTDAQLSRMIDARLEGEYEAIGKAIGELLLEEREHADERMEEKLAEERKQANERMEEKLGELRAEVEILRSIVKAGNVEQLVRKTNAA